MAVPWPRLQRRQDTACEAEETTLGFWIVAAGKVGSRSPGTLTSRACIRALLRRPGVTILKTARRPPDFAGVSGWLETQGSK